MNIGNPWQLFAENETKIKKQTQKYQLVGQLRRGQRNVERIEVVYLPKQKEIIEQFGMFENKTRFEKLNVEGIDNRIVLHEATPTTWAWMVLRLTGPKEFVKMIEERILINHWHISNDELHLHEMGGITGDRRPCSKEECKRIIKNQNEYDIFRMLGIRYFEPEARSTKLLSKEIQRIKQAWRQ